MTRATNQGGSTGFTPGPWGYTFDKKDTGFEGDTFMAGPLHCDGTGGFSSVIEGGLVLADDNENEANARLIAAAPELYEALRQAHAKFVEYAEIHRAKVGTKDASTPAKMNAVLEKVERNLEMAKVCDAALCKAEGREP